MQTHYGASDEGSKKHFFPPISTCNWWINHLQITRSYEIISLRISAQFIQKILNSHFHAVFHVIPQYTSCGVLYFKSACGNLSFMQILRQPGMLNFLERFWNTRSCEKDDYSLKIFHNEWTFGHCSQKSLMWTFEREC